MGKLTFLQNYKKQKQPEKKNLPKLAGAENQDLIQAIHAAIAFIKSSSVLNNPLNQRLTIIQPLANNKAIYLEFEPEDIVKFKADHDYQLPIQTHEYMGIWFLPEQQNELTCFSADPVVQNYPWDDVLYHLSRSITAIIKHQNLKIQFEQTISHHEQPDKFAYQFVQPHQNGQLIRARVTWANNRQRISFDFEQNQFLLPKI